MGPSGRARASARARDDSVVGETTARLLELCRRTSDGEVKVHDVARVVARAMSGEDGRTLRPDPRAFTTFASRLTRAKAYVGALRVFEAQKLLGVERNAVNYNAAMVANVKRDAPLEALKLFEEMVAIGHEPSVISYNVAMGACARAGDGARALRLFDELASKGLTPDAVSVNTAIAAAEMVGDDARAAELRGGSHFHSNHGGDDDGAAPAETRDAAGADERVGDSDSDSDSEDGSDDDGAEPDVLRHGTGDEVEPEDLGEEEEAKRAAARKRKREAKRRLLAEYKKNTQATEVEEEDEEMAKRRRKDARRAKFEEKRRARKEAKREKRPWTVAAAHVKRAEKSSKASKRASMKADPRVWIEDIPSDDDVTYDDDGERVLPPIKGPSFLDDPRAATLMNARDDADDFWSVGF